METQGCCYGQGANFMKKCSKCGKSKPRAMFNKDSSLKDGLRTCCKLCARKSTREHYFKNRRRLIKQSIERQKRNKKAWSEFFDEEYGTNPRCQINGEQLSWFGKDGNNTVRWDHRNGKSAIPYPPANFLAVRPCTPKNQEIWRSCDFGILCNVCNQFLPTEDREQWMKKAMNYVERITNDN